MKFISPNTELIDECNPLKKIEIAGRTCYKSDSEFTDESAKKFVDTMIKRKHYAMLEHGQFTFVISGMKEGQIDPQFLSIPYIRHSYRNGTYIITVSMSHLCKWPLVPNTDDISEFTWQIYYRMQKIVNDIYFNDLDQQFAIFDGIVVRLIEDIEDLEYATYEDVMLHKSMTLRFTCDRGVSHELVRHRYSPAQESQRYCNYGKDKFGNEITFIAPCDFDSWEDADKELFITALKNSETIYLKLLELGKTPQQARAVLPNATKTEVVFTMPLFAWEHFLDLRSRGTTGAPHPDMKVVADIAAAHLEPTFTRIKDKYLNPQR